MKITSLCLAILVGALCQYNVDADDCFRLSAAFNYDGDLFLVDDDKYIELNEEFQEVDDGLLVNRFKTKGGDMDAAITSPEDGYLYFFQGNAYRYYPTAWWQETSSEEPSGGEWGDFFELGIDAAGSLGDVSYFFSGCEHVVGSRGDFVQGDNEVVGFPCDVDAAFGHDDKLYVTQGDRFWVKVEGKNAEGPIPLTELLTLKSTHICKEEINPFVAKIREEKKFEEENQCVIIDAAITWDNQVYLFNNDEYLTLDDEGHEKENASIREWGLLSPNIDAGVVWKGNGATYFFKGQRYFRYTYNYFVNWAFGPFGNALWSPFFEEGIDAAGNHDGKSYFFKGCEAQLYIEEDDTTTLKNEDLGLPCDVDAAYSVGDSMHVIKRDEVWTWESGADKATGPEALSKFVTLENWKACPQ